MCKCESVEVALPEVRELGVAVHSCNLVLGAGGVRVHPLSAILGCTVNWRLA